MSAGDWLDKYNFEYLLKEALSKVSNNVDKREGSIIYDTLAIACYQLSAFYLDSKDIILQTYALTNNGEYLDLKVAEAGLERYGATFSQKKGTFKDSNNAVTTVPLGSRFSTIAQNPEDILIYRIIKEDVGIGSYILECETAGTIGNIYIGNLVPISYIPNLGTATMGAVYIPARDLETDEELRKRYLDIINHKPFGGNISQYKQETKSINGVGGVQVYPIWNGGGTVKLSVIDTNYNPITQPFIDLIQDTIDPTNGSGTGLGIAPIGHKVTVTTPIKIDINIEADITPKTGYTNGQLQKPIEDAIKSYLSTLKTSWDIGNNFNVYSMTIYISRIINQIINVDGVENVTAVTINNSAVDFVLTQTSTTQQLPELGVVTLT